MDPRIALAAASRDGHAALRRVERQQWLIERLFAAHGQRMTLRELSHELGVSERSIARDVERLILSGVPLETHRGRAGGVSLRATTRVEAVTFDLPEVAALMSSLTTLGPSVSESAASAMAKLRSSIRE